MIHRVLVRKYIGQSALLWWSLAVALFSFAWVRVWVVSLLDMSEFQMILEPLKKFEKFAPISFDALTTYAGRTAMTFDEPIVILCIVIWCIARGSDVVSGELGRGTLEMLLSQPIRRRTLLVSHAVVSIFGLALLCLLVWGGIAAGVHFTEVRETVPSPTFRVPLLDIDVPLSSASPQSEMVPLSERVELGTFAASVVHLFAFGFFILALATLFSSVDRYRWRTIGAVMTVYVIEAVLFGLGKAAPSLEWLLSLSFFSCYKPQPMSSLYLNEGPAAPWSLTAISDPLSLPPLVYPLILIGTGIVCYVVAGRIFERRDLPAPL